MKELIKNFELINDQFKVPVFVELNKDAIDIWKRFVGLRFVLENQVEMRLSKYNMGWNNI